LTTPETETYTEFMTRQRRIAMLLTGVVLTSGLLSAQALERAMYVSVLDKKGTPVDIVAPGDLVVREDNVTREVLRVVPAGEPMQIALLVDDSAPAERYIRDYREALPAFIEEILADESVTGKHQISVIGLAGRPTIITQYTSDKAELIKGVNRIFAQQGSGSYLMDGIREVGRGMMKRPSTRPIMVLVTTEGPELSGRDHAQTLEPLRNSGAALHVIVVGNPTNQQTERAVFLNRGPAESGGQYDVILTGSALTQRLKKLATELTHQYQVTYARPKSLIPPEKVTISSPRTEWVVRGTAEPLLPTGRK
jgi:hypothetical protein